jgi:hypothetical protein
VLLAALVESQVSQAWVFLNPDFIRPIPAEGNNLTVRTDSEATADIEENGQGIQPAGDLPQTQGIRQRLCKITFQQQFDCFGKPFL